MASAPTNPLPDEALNCLEVRGGHGAADNFFRRPGMDVWIHSRAENATDVGGGDLHYISSCASGRITRMLMADVCGIGEQFGEVANELKTVVKGNVNSIRQVRAVKQMSSRLKSASANGAFASTLISTYFAPTRSLSVCNAGNPPPLLFRSMTGEWSAIKVEPAAAPTGEMDPGLLHPGEYQQYETKLEPGDMLLCYSNCFVECRHHSGRTMGIEGFQRLVANMIEAEPGPDVLQTLEDRLLNENDANLLDGDATMILCRATDTPVNIKDNLLAPLRLFKPVSDRTKVD